MNSHTKIQQKKTSVVQSSPISPQKTKDILN